MKRDRCITGLEIIKLHQTYTQVLETINRYIYNLKLKT